MAVSGAASPLLLTLVAGHGVSKVLAAWAMLVRVAAHLRVARLVLAQLAAVVGALMLTLRGDTLSTSESADIGEVCLR
jgi:hypothetical protein